MDITSPLAVLILGSTLLLVYWNIFRPQHGPSLKQIPGPLFAKLTSYYIILIDAAGNRTRHIHKLHQKYGPVVRIGPNEVSFSAPSVSKELYGQGTPYMKAPWYDYMAVPPPGIFAMRDKKAHNSRKRLLNHAFSQSIINDTEPIIAALIMKTLDIVTATKGTPIDMLQVFRRLSLDIVGQLFMGQSFQALDSEEPPKFLEWMDNMFVSLGIQYAFPLVHKLMVVMPLKGPQEVILGPTRIAEYGAKSFYQYIEENGRQSKRRDFLTKILNANANAEGASEGEGIEKQAVLSDRIIYQEIGNLVFAGTDTTSSTLTYLFWELAQNQKWQDRLREELKAHVSDDKIVPKYSSLVDLPILDAIINESLRLHPSAPASLPRSTPAGGRTLDGHFIPEDTVVSMQCYTTHRDPLAFPNPETWDPDRWLHPNPDIDPSRVKDLFMPFSRGPRACLGQNLAMVELKLTTAALVLRTRTDLAPETTKESMQIIDHFLAVPKSGKCMLRMEVV